MASNLDAVKSFNDQIRKFLLTIPDLVEDEVRAVALDGTSRIVQKTPVDTGRARANWTVSINGSFDYSISQWEGRDPVVEASAILGADMPAFPIIYIFNNVHYIGYLEDGWSRQAPVGMVAVTLAELEAKFGP